LPIRKERSRARRSAGNRGNTAINTDVVRAEVRSLVRGREYLSFDDAVANFPLEHINTRPPNVPYTPWHLLEHMRIAQRDILDYIREPHYREPTWPDDYWPHPDARADEKAWKTTIEAFRRDLTDLDTIASDRGTDLSARLPYRRPHTFLRELLIVADHNAYHTGEFAILRQVMGTWPPGRR
jgi:DinB superfamily